MDSWTGDMPSDTAVILAGGLGTRLQPFTLELPKPLLPLEDIPILEVIIRQLSRDGFKRCILAVNHQASLISDYFGDGSQWNISIDYSLEKKALGTMAPLKLIPDLPSSFLVMNGDILTDFPFAKFLSWGRNISTPFGISRTSALERSSFGVLTVDEESRLIGFEEKPARQLEVSTGIYFLRSDTVELIPNNQFFGFDDLVEKCLQQAIQVDTFSFSGYWRDLGTPNDYLQAQKEFSEMRRRFL